MKIVFICRNANHLTTDERTLLYVLKSEHLSDYNEVTVFETETQKKLPDFKDFDVVIFSQNLKNGFNTKVKNSPGGLYKQLIFNLKV